MSGLGEIGQNVNFGSKRTNFGQKRAKKGQNFFFVKTFTGLILVKDQKCSFNMQNWQHPMSGCEKLAKITTFVSKRTNFGQKRAIKRVKNNFVKIFTGSF